MTATERLDPRVERTRRVVLDAAASLLTDHGFDPITIDAIAEQTGVARSTIYRNWPDRADLRRNAFEVVCGMPLTPDQGSLVGDFRSQAADRPRSPARGVGADGALARRSRQPRSRDGATYSR